MASRSVLRTSGRRVVWVHGAAGLGKSALTAALVGALDGPCVVRLDGAEPSSADLTRRVIRALAQSQQVGIDELPRAADDDERLAQLLDLADAAHAVVWLDGVDAELSDAVRLAQLAERYARCSTWVFTSRSAPDGWAGWTLALAPLSHEAMTEIAKARDPSLDSRAAARLAREADGVPGRLSPSTRDRQPLPPSAMRARALLGELVRPVPLDALAGIIEASDLAILQERGVLVGGPAAVRVHADPELGLAPDEARLALAHALASHPDAEPRLEALRSFLALKETPDAVALLARSGTLLLEQGYAPELWEVLATTDERALAPFRLRAAAEHGDPAALGPHEDPGTDAHPSARFGWLKVRYAMEDHRCVAAEAPALAEILERASHDELAWEAWLMAAASSMSLGDFDRAVTWIDRSKPRGERAVLLVEALRATLAARRGDAASARASAARIEARLPGLSGRARATVTYNLGLVLYGLGDPAHAADLFARTFPVDDLSTTALVGRRALEMDAHLSVLGGRLDRAAALLERLEKFVVPGAPVEARRSLISATVDLLSGRLLDAERGAAFGVACAERYAGDEDVAYGLTLLAQVAWRRGQPAPRSTHTLQGVSARLAHTWSALAELAHHGELRASLETPHIPNGTYAELAVAEQTLVAMTRLCAGDRTPELLAELLTLEARAAALSALPARVCSTLLLQDLLVLAGAAAPFTRVDGSIEWERARALHRAIGCGAPAPQLAALVGEPGLVGEIAGALLGGLEPRGWLARALTQRWPKMLGWSVRRAAPGAGQGATYLDAPRARLDDGSAVVDLSSHPVLLRLLESLVAEGGSASKEALIVRTWPVREYHPLKHDNRLRLAVRKLRKLLPLPELIVTLEDGYALSRPMVCLGESLKGS